MVAVDDIPLLVHRQAAVGIAVKGEAHIQVVRNHKAAQVLDMGRAAVDIDVQAVRIVGNHMGVGTQGVKNALGHHPGAAVGTVETDAHPFIRAGRKRDEIADIAVAPGGIVDGAADVGAGGIRQLFIRVDIGLDAVQQFLLHLFAVGVNQLDAVVGIGIVAGGDHDAAVKIVGTGDVGHAGRAGHMQQESVRTGGSQARTESGLIHIAGAAGILADDDLRTVIPPIVPAEIAADLESMIHGQVLVGLSPESVRTEILSHVFSFFLNSLLCLQSASCGRVRANSDVCRDLQEGSRNDAVIPGIQHIKNRFGFFLSHGQHQDLLRLRQGADAHGHSLFRDGSAVGKEPGELLFRFTGQLLNAAAGRKLRTGFVIADTGVYPKAEHRQIQTAAAADCFITAAGVFFRQPEAVFLGDADLPKKPLFGQTAETLLLRDTEKLGRLEETGCRKIGLAACGSFTEKLPQGKHRPAGGQRQCRIRLFTQQGADFVRSQAEHFVLRPYQGFHVYPYFCSVSSLLSSSMKVLMSLKLR